MTDTAATRADAAAAPERLRAALDPRTDQEQQVVAWLEEQDLSTIETISEMVERVGRHAYDRGYAERYQHQ